MKKKKLLRLLPHRLSRGKGDANQLAAQLAPLEEQRGDVGRVAISTPTETATGVMQKNGAIVVGNHNPHLPQDLLEGDKRERFLALDPVVMVIVGLLLAFILFIAWQISRLPPE